jgi:hypothetical protein
MTMTRIGRLVLVVLVVFFFAALAAGTGFGATA